MFKTVAILLFIIIAFGCNAPEPSPYQSINFTKKSVMSPTGRASAVSFVIDGYGYVALGRTDLKSGALNDCWKYNPVDDSWKEMKPFPGLARVNAVAEVVNGMAYVGLGFDISKQVYTGGNLFDFYMYNPAKDEWFKKTGLDSLKTTATNSCVSFVFNDKIYVGIGFDGAGFTDEFWMYNPEDDSWKKINNFAGSYRAGAVLCANNNHVYCGTGFNTYNLSDWWEYLPESDTWIQLKNMPDMGRENATALSINNRFFVATGRNFGGNLSGGYLKADFMEYDVDKNVWYKRGEIPGEARENAISFSINGIGYIGFGGNDTHVLNDFWSFEP